ncbi:MAG TPA: CoA transferase [Acetobacteraceae bacterium]|nr:CoA transferase [Acetobacteraceae bacterium]
MNDDAPYAGLKVIDLSQGVAGPYCAMLLARHGADVIKIEPPEGGDWSRGLGPKHGDQTAYSLAANLGKRSVALDLKSPRGKEVLRRLLRGADVFLQGFRPGVIERLGFGYEAVREIASSVVYVSISGFGQRGPLAERPAMDPVLQAYTGLTNENAGEDGIPHRVPIIAVDMTTALYAFSAVAPALFGRARTGKGKHIETSLMQSAAALQVVRMLQYEMEGGAIRPPAAPSGVYKAADGWINVTVARQHEWVAFCEAVERPALAADPRFATADLRVDHAEALRALLRPLLAGRSVADWSDRFAARRVMHERLNSYAEFLAQPHVRASGAVSWINHPDVARTIPLPNLPGAPAFATGEVGTIAPRLGEHTREVLAEHGFGAAEIESLAAERVIGV